MPNIIKNRKCNVADAKIKSLL